ncbi:hypothetical protein [Cysteiniphilum halobium]|uniref:hypothetical protein n=1 Tax=Cysteiniphilum halobium TaxID=2219059 RepID=UPI000E647AC0|nr:hypothetical protein [Cysteiniphilum halobium]
MTTQKKVNPQNQESSIADDLDALNSAARSSYELVKGTKDEQVYADFLKASIRAQKSFNKLLKRAEDNDNK